MGEAHGMTLLPLLSRHEAEEILFAEARLLDDGLYEKWLELFTDDGIYWIPSDESSDPDEETSIIYDDSRQREKRIFQLRNKHLAQDPLSRTIHFISNVEVEETKSPEEVTVRCNAIVAEMRPGDHQELHKGIGDPRLVACRCNYRLRQENDLWRIAVKQVKLINRDVPLQNITFIV
jgi:3-phenylpropionate/cinnamic acid dioxygenase small subunit